MKPITLCMIVKNEESVLAQCLESIAFIADEIVIVDTGSTDKTIEIAKRFTNKIYHFDWIDDFSAARNFALTKTTNDYIFTIDADCTLTPESKKALQHLKEHNFNNKDLIFFNWILETGMNNAPIRTIYTPYIFKKSKFHWESPIHNQLILDNKKQTAMLEYHADITVIHHKDREEKSHRYDQTKRILEKTLAKDPENFRLRYLYGETLFFLKKYHEALPVFKMYLREKKNVFEIRQMALGYVVFCYLHVKQKENALQILNEYASEFHEMCRYELTCADVYSTLDIEKARDFFIAYLRHPLESHNFNYNFDYERFQVYPYLMLGLLALKSNNKKEAKKYFNITLQKTRKKDTYLLAHQALLKLQNEYS